MGPTHPRGGGVRMRSLRVVLLRRLYRVAWRGVQLRALVWRRRGDGVKCVLTHGGEVLLVRHTYGRRDTWYLPGGAVRRDEPPPRAGAREMEEELGLRELGLEGAGRVRHPPGGDHGAPHLHATRSFPIPRWCASTPWRSRRPAGMTPGGCRSRAGARSIRCSRCCPVPRPEGQRSLHRRRRGVYHGACRRAQHTPQREPRGWVRCLKG